MMNPDDARQVVHSDPVEQGWIQFPKFVAHDPTLSPEARLLYALLKGYARDDTFPGQDGLAELLGVTERQVRYLLSELRDKGLIRIERHGLGQTNRYVILSAHDKALIP